MGEDMSTSTGFYTTPTCWTTVPQVYSRKDIDEAYNRGFNDANLGERQVFDDQDYSCSLVCGTCASCGRGAPYANFCIWCGKPFKRKRGDTE